MEICVLREEKRGGKIKGLVFDELAVKICCLDVRVCSEFVLYGLAANFVPAEGAVFLAEPAVAAHQPAVGILATGVLGQDFL